MFWPIHAIGLMARYREKGKKKKRKGERIPSLYLIFQCNEIVLSTLLDNFGAMTQVIQLGWLGSAHEYVWHDEHFI